MKTTYKRTLRKPFDYRGWTIRAYPEEKGTLYTCAKGQRLYGQTRLVDLLSGIDGMEDRLSG